MSKGAIITEFKAWITPMLIVMVGYFAKSKLESIDKRLDVLETIQTNQVKLTMRVDYIEPRLNTLESQFYSHVRITDVLDEKEITLSKLKNK